MITLRLDQERAVEALLSNKRGIVKAPAGSGKTIIAAAAIARWQKCQCDVLGKPGHVSWIANTIEQCQQAEEACKAMGAGLVDIYCYQAGRSVEDSDLAVIDECHHIASAENRKLVEGYDGVLWGFSATPERADDLRDDVFTLIGPVICEIERKELIDSGKLAPAKVIFHAPNDRDELLDMIEGDAAERLKGMRSAIPFTAAKMKNKSVEQVARLLGGDTYTEILLLAEQWSVETESTFFALMQAAQARSEAVRTSGWLRAAAEKELLSRCRWHACQMLGVTENDARNRRIIELAQQHSEDSALILVGSIEHGKDLQAQIPGAQMLYSKMGAKKRREAMEAFRSGELKCAIATSLADEGLDVPRANVLILAAAGRSAAKAEQRTGRVLRSWGEKTHGVIHDLWDWQHPLLLNQSRARAKVYAELNYEFVSTEPEELLVTVLKSVGINRHPALPEILKKKKRLRAKAAKAEKNLQTSGAGVHPASGVSVTTGDGPTPDDNVAGSDPAGDGDALKGSTVAARGFEVPSVSCRGAAEGSTGNSRVSSAPTQINSELASPGGWSTNDCRTVSQEHETCRNKISKETGCINPEAALHSRPVPAKAKKRLKQPDTNLSGGVSAPMEHGPTENLSQNSERVLDRNLSAEGDLAPAQNLSSTTPAAPPATGSPTTPGTPALKHETREHAKFSPSGLSSKATCPGFINDDTGDKTVANRGSLGHQACEEERPDLCGEDFALRTAVVSCLGYIQRVTKGKKVFKEVKVEVLADGVFGHADLIAVKDAKADLIDLKFGQRFYAAAGLQSKAYCIGVWNKFPKVEQVTSHFLMPFRDEIDIEVFTRAEHYDKFVTEIVAVIARAKQEDPATFTTNWLCQYCARAGKCPALAKLGVEIAERYEGERVSLPEGSLHGSEITDPEAIAQLMAISPIAERAAGSWKKRGLSMWLEDGIAVPGYELVERSGKRVISSAKAAFELVKEHGVTQDQFLELCTVSAPQLVDVVAAAAPRGDKGRMKDLFESQLVDADLLSHGEGAKFLKKITK